MPVRTVALNVVVRNQEAELEKLLSLCANYVDEIVVVHDGPCFDDSINLALVCGATVYEGELHEDDAPHRRVALALTESDWVLALEPGDIPESRFLDDLFILVSRAGMDAYVLKRHIYVGDGLAEEVPVHALFRVLPWVQYSMLPDAPVPYGLGEVGQVIDTDYVMRSERENVNRMDAWRARRGLIGPRMEQFSDLPEIVDQLQESLVARK